jgi:glutamyl-tRNA synthetase
MMGWTMPEGEEVFSLAEMQAAFDIERVSLGGPVFDIVKLDWLNGKYLREQGDDAQFVARLLSWAQESGRLEPIVPLLRQRVEKLSDVAPLINYFFSGDVALSAHSFEHCKLDVQLSIKCLQFALWRLEGMSEWNRDAVEHVLMALAKEMDVKVRDFLAPLFVAISGQAVSLSVIDSIAVIGLDLSRARLRHAIESLGGISKKQAKALEKEFAGLAIIGDATT